jgi:hypothetical protein
MRSPFQIGALLALSSLVLPAAQAQSPAEALGVVADQVRAQGLPCSQPSGIERDPSLSRPDLPVWVLTCDEGRYRVELVPDMRARVIPLD